MKKIRKGDNVIILSGKDRGKQSTIIRFVNAEKVVVRDVNRVKSHVKPNPSKNIIGGIVEIEKPIHISNVAIFNIDKNKADRVGFRFDESGSKVRYFKSDGTLIDS
ncbi:50S ribosomal protein L24 [Nitrosomonas sp. HPC101]|uniref:50S ribosomal protein L24 n=1 Tax=Nitrosomonas sp. HPC101 TaxID=1658667 RepID=UPI0013696657|nr:50S ribosomal protein L24 [Nitrosomonas sp. HPC101]MXS84990.1 50S ribosomal protein L24 [Nitrosomonas sp. HPC101]